MEIKNTVISTQKLLDEANKLLLDKNKKYYNDVLDFMNLLFDDNAKILSKIKFKKITLNENVFELYNQIIKTYKLPKPEFDIENFYDNFDNNFDLSEIEDLDEIKKVFFDIAFKISNNLLEKLNYKLRRKFDKIENKTKFILQQNI